MNTVAVQPFEPFFFDREHLKRLAEGNRERYAAADPFPHIVLDDFLPPGIAQRIASEFPEPRDIEWQRFSSPSERKLASADPARMPAFTRQVLAEFNSRAVCDFLSVLTGIDGLIPDPHYVGGGLHQIEPGGFLKVHADFNHHEGLRLDRRLNLLLYLNDDWKEEYGGHLQLWTTDLQRCAARVLPVLNRCVIFSTTSDSYHGHPDPLTCPPDRRRRSLALYYYSNGRPEEQQRPSHSTLFVERPGEHFRIRERASKVVRKLVPPVIFDLARAIRGKSD
jgi:hypothetical protein